MKIFTFLLAILSLQMAFAQEGHKIEVELENFAQEELYLGYYFGDKQYLRDTTKINEQGKFIFADEEPLEQGVYLIVMPPDNKFIQIQVGEDQVFSIKTDANEPNAKMKVKGSKDNELFYDYLAYLGEKRPLADTYNKGIEAAGEDEQQKKILEKKLEELNDEVVAYQKKLVAENPKTLTAALIKANVAADMPEFEGEDKEVKRWRWMQKHYFDQIDMTDERMIRTPFLFQRVDHYVNKMVVQHPDTIYEAVDMILQKVQPAEETFKYFLVHFLNTYAKAPIVGMDGVYVKIAKNYYGKGLAPWTEEEQLKKIVENAETLEPLLIGKTAPDFSAFNLDIDGTLKAAEVETSEHKKFKLGAPMTLHDVESPYTVLIFWASDCGHCKKDMPGLVKFYDDYKAKGVEVFAVCTKTYKDIPECAEVLVEKDALRWINIVDPYHRSKMTKIYDVRSTPQIYVLDENKEIVSKRIGVEQLPKVIDDLMRMDKEENTAIKEGK